MPYLIPSIRDNPKCVCCGRGFASTGDKKVSCYHSYGIRIISSSSEQVGRATRTTTRFDVMGQETGFVCKRCLDGQKNRMGVKGLIAILSSVGMIVLGWLLWKPLYLSSIVPIVYVLYFIGAIVPQINDDEIAGGLMLTRMLNRSCRKKGLKWFYVTSQEYCNEWLHGTRVRR